MDSNDLFKDIDIAIVSVLRDQEHPASLSTFGREPFDQKPDEKRNNLKNDQKGGK